MCNPPFVPPTVAQFKAQFYRDFPFLPASNPDTTNLNFVQDVDVQGAITLAGININPAFWPDQPTYTLVYNLLAAHYLVVSFQNSSTGLGGSAGWVTQHQNVDAVQNTYTVPKEIMAWPEFATISKTRYGQEYIGLCMPYIRGQMFASYDPAHASS